MLINTLFKVKPFLKWAGGKTQLLKQFEDYYPTELKLGLIKNYYEPFIGSGAVFFDIVTKYQIENYFISDNNEELVLVYKVIQNDVYKLIDNLDLYKKKYLSLNDKKREEYFYETRNFYNYTRSEIDHSIYSPNWIPRAAQMIFLNKTCFNGLFRLNSKGEFNVPFGGYKNPSFFDEENLINISSLLQKTSIVHSDFKCLPDNINKSSFIYFDPPYRPISKTSSFTSYNKEEFNDDEQKNLSSVFRKLDKLGCYLMLSNSEPQNINPEDNFFRELYNGFNFYSVNANRMINCNGSKRGKIKELLITNY